MKDHYVVANLIFFSFKKRLNDSTLDCTCPSCQQDTQGKWKRKKQLDPQLLTTRHFQDLEEPFELHNLQEKWLTTLIFGCANNNLKFGFRLTLTSLISRVVTTKVHVILRRLIVLTWMHDDRYIIHVTCTTID
jgi:hypothetical protein